MIELLYVFDNFFPKLKKAQWEVTLTWRIFLFLSKATKIVFPLKLFSSSVSIFWNLQKRVWKAGVSKIDWRAILYRKKWSAGRSLMEISGSGPKSDRKARKISQICSKFIILSIYEIFEGHTNISGGPRVWDPCFIEVNVFF